MSNDLNPNGLAETDNHEFNIKDKFTNGKKKTKESGRVTVRSR